MAIAVVSLGLILEAKPPPGDALALGVKDAQIGR
jgi:hypothetical protein